MNKYIVTMRIKDGESGLSHREVPVEARTFSGGIIEAGRLHPAYIALTVSVNEYKKGWEKRYAENDCPVELLEALIALTVSAKDAISKDPHKDWKDSLADGIDLADSLIRKD